MAINGFSKSRNVDVVFVVDGTGSMQPCIDMLKNSLKSFQVDLMDEAKDQNINIESVRTKIITFRDYKDDGNDAMVESPFMTSDVDDEMFDKYVNSITAFGGGDNPENSLEALFLAMSSDFVTGPDDRQVIVLFTDDNALDLKMADRVTNPIYPENMVASVDGLAEYWEGIGVSQSAEYKLRDRLKRMIIYAPENTVFDQFPSKFKRCILNHVNMEAGMKEITFEDVMKVIVSSVSSK